MISKSCEDNRDDQLPQRHGGAVAIAFGGPMILHVEGNIPTKLIQDYSNGH